MHATIREILEARGLNDQTRYPTGDYALQVYEAICEELFPHLVLAPEPNDSLSEEVLLFAKLRKVFQHLGIQLIISDIQSPDPDRLGAHLDKLGVYATFRDEQLEDKNSLANECARKLVKLNSISEEKKKLQQQVETLEAELSKDRSEYAVLQEKNRENQILVKTKYDECEALARRANEAKTTKEAKSQELARVKSSIEANQAAIANLRPYVDERTGVAKSAKADVERLSTEVKQVKDRQKTLLNTNTQLEQACSDLKSIESQLPGLEETLKNYKKQKEVFDLAQREQNELTAETERKKRVLSSLQDSVQDLESQMQQLREQEAKLRADVDNTAEEWNQAISTMEAEEQKLMRHIRDLRVSTDEVKRKLKSQREYNQQVEQLLHSAPKKMAGAERELDALLNEIASIKVKPPPIASE